MALFKTREPRKFNRVSIYTSERKDKLDKLVRDVKREAGELPPEDIDPEKFKGKFSQFTPLAHRGGRRLAWPLALLVILLLIWAWRYILTGRIAF